MGDRICLMKDGRIQQVDTPLEIYNRPANMFVAAFIGSPPMNFFEGTLVQKEGGLFFTETTDKPELGQISVQISKSHAPKLAAWLNKKLVFGIRPEDIEDRTVVSNPDPAQIFGATLEVTEPMGAETFFYLTTGRASFIVRSPGQIQEEIGRKVQLIARMEKAHFFELIDKNLYKKDSGDLDIEKWHTACPLIV